MRNEVMKPKGVIKLKFTGLAVVMLAAALFAQDAEKKFPNIKQSGDIALTPRMEINGGKDSEGEKIENGVNRRRLMLAWNYKLNVAINEKLDLGFWLADPEDGATVAGSGASWKKMLTPMLRNATFTWKPASAFNLSGGLVNVSGLSVDLATVIQEKDPTKSYSNVHFSSLAGFKFDFPIASAFKLYAIAGISDNTNSNMKDMAVGENDTIRAYSDGRIIFGADISLADKKVSLKPSIQILTRRNTLIGDEETGFELNKDMKPLIAEGLDMSFKLASAFSINAGIGAAHNTYGKDAGEMLFNFGVEPVLNFGGENGKLFNFRAKYGMFMLNDQTKDNKNESAIINHIDTRFGINVNDKFAIVPRYRLWAGNNGSWFGYNAEGADNKATKTLSRLELGFNASF